MGSPEPVRPQPRKPQQQVEIDNPGANQYEVHLPADQAAKAGLPAVHYQVNMRGDVNAQVNVGGRNLEANWSGEQARAPYAALGAAKDQAEKQVNQWTRQASDQLKQVVPGMVEKAWGRIIQISSVNGEKGQAGQTNYSAAKAGMHGFTMALAQELAAKGVTVNTVSPGYIGTDMVKAIKPEILEKIVATIPVKRLGTPEEIGSVVAWLAGDDSGFTTGADFSCNGGLHMG